MCSTAPDSKRQKLEEQEQERKESSSDKAGKGKESERWMKRQKRQRTDYIPVSTFHRKFRLQVKDLRLT